MKCLPSFPLPARGKGRRTLTESAGRTKRERRRRRLLKNIGVSKCRMAREVQLDALGLFLLDSPEGGLVIASLERDGLAARSGKVLPKYSSSRVLPKHSDS